MRICLNITLAAVSAALLPGTLTGMAEAPPQALWAVKNGGSGTNRLTQVELTHENSVHEVTIICADDLFAVPSDQGIPETGQITRAVFDIQFTGRVRAVTL